MIETRSIGAICSDLKAKGEHEAADVLECVAYANAELSEVNIDLLEELQHRYVQSECGCDHPACSFCEDDRHTLKVFKKATGEKEDEETE